MDTFIIKNTNQTYIIRKNNIIEKYKPYSKISPKKEYDILMSLNHPNIVKCLDYNEEQSVIKLEYIKGPNLHVYLEKNYLTEMEIFNIFSQVANAVYYCHSNNITHGDIKLENCVIDNELSVKLIDFEFANKFVDNNVSVRKVFGTPIYLSPELAKIINKNLHTDDIEESEYKCKPVDIWSLGIMLYELVFRCHPFSYSCHSMEMLVNSIIYEEISFWKNNENKKLKKLLKNMLQHDINKRYTIEQVINSSWFKKFRLIKKLPSVFTKKYNRYIIINDDLYKSYNNKSEIPD
ncbi:serine/threonine protein kinase [Hokovirus HKV1]|uniref:Serine/threonine protein kinase n=1 Tax=Hokovirus HKV1 TaxID=1977638 RepID=A0A1V0SFV0_9VIRU|nr:serine/threonine protein kinase [Hokovirus HKV1]